MNIVKFGRAQKRPQRRHLTGQKFKNSRQPALQTRFNRGTSSAAWNGTDTWYWDRNLSDYCDDIREVQLI
jgi:hypothetical protein